MKVIWILLVILVLFSGCRIGEVADKELSAPALLAKYEWFKDASAALDKKVADITVYEARFKSLDEAYKDTPRTQWARDDRNQWSIWQSECAGIKASYNQLASEYNAQMAKINWAFTNAGELPKGATKVLPREYKTYLTE